MLKFKIEQIAIAPKDPQRARQLLEEMGALAWVQDKVSAVGYVFNEAAENEATLQFNYELFGGKEFEILDYTQGKNWIDNLFVGRGVVSHLGMHCTEEELVLWKDFFTSRGINIAQQVITTSHTNPAIAGQRRYQYMIFDTREILGVDLKFIVRLPF